MWHRELNNNEQLVLVITYDRNRKQHFIICPTMEEAKSLYPSAEKRFITVKRDYSIFM